MKPVLILREAVESVENIPRTIDVHGQQAVRDDLSYDRRCRTTWQPNNCDKSTSDGQGPGRIVAIISSLP